MKDSILKQAVIDEIAFEPSIDDNDIGVAVEDGIVTLTGHVPSFEQKVAIERATGRVKGVKGIAEKIEVRSAPGTSDDELARRLVNTLKWGTMLPDDAVQVKVEHGRVTLTGVLDWQYQRLGAEAAARRLKGVRGIINDIQLRARVSPVDVRKHIEDALKRSAEVEANAVKVEVVGHAVTLSGNVRAWGERRAIERAAWATPGVTSVVDLLTVG